MASICVSIGIVPAQVGFIKDEILVLCGQGSIAFKQDSGMAIVSKQAPAGITINAETMNLRVFGINAEKVEGEVYID
jgi:hypothetical protein